MTQHLLAQSYILGALALLPATIQSARVLVVLLFHQMPSEHAHLLQKCVQLQHHRYLPHPQFVRRRQSLAPSFQRPTACRRVSGILLRSSSGERRTLTHCLIHNNLTTKTTAATGIADAVADVCADIATKQFKILRNHPNRMQNDIDGVLVRQ